jgi:type IV fimbrial biogenesis protein FimT
VLGVEEGRIVLKASRARGFTLVELLVGVTILGALLALGAPAMGTYLQNSKLASAASSYYSGLQTARTEAIRRNVPTQFVLTDTPVTTSDLANVAAPAVAGRNWIVRAASGPADFVPVIEAKAAGEGNGSSSGLAIVLAGAASAPVVFDGTVPFNGFGGTATNTTYTIDVSNPAGGDCAAASGPMRCRRIVVSPGGQIAVCDPAAPAGDSRAC